MSKNKLIETKIALLANEYQSIHFQNINQLFEKNVKMKHDFDNHLLVINKLIDNFEINESKKYLNDLIKKSSSKTIVHSNNKTLNYIINIKLENYVGDLRFSCQTNLKPLSDFEIVTIFSNLISNALEAQESINNPYINISIYEKDGNLYIKIINKYIPSYVEHISKNKLPTTNKLDTIHHGLGLKNVKEIILNHSGNIHFETIDNLFITICQIKR